MKRPRIHTLKLAKTRARELRASLTDSEKRLWKELRNRKLSGYKFLRQHPIIYRSFLEGSNYFIADFYCDLKKVVIELDGPIHDTTVEYDEFRNSEMENLGLHVLRLKNEELLDMNEALQKIAGYMD
jgi:leucyl-tRNA synthetase